MKKLQEVKSELWVNPVSEQQFKSWKINRKIVRKEPKEVRQRFAATLFNSRSDYKKTSDTWQSYNREVNKKHKDESKNMTRISYQNFNFYTDLGFCFFLSSHILFDLLVIKEHL